MRRDRLELAAGQAILKGLFYLSGGVAASKMADWLASRSNPEKVLISTGNNILLL